MQDSSRRRAREFVLQSLYACEHGRTDPQDVFENIIKNESLKSKHLQFAQTLLKLVTENINWADEQITRFSENWDLTRIAAVDRNILRMALVELEKISETPVNVVLNEAIELAKLFSTMQSSSFVNGILDNFVKSKDKV